MHKTTQKQIRNLIMDGIAIDANKLPYERLYDLACHADKIALSTGIYGMNGGIFKDSRDGQLYAIASRSTALFIVF